MFITSTARSIIRKCSYQKTRLQLQFRPISNINGIDPLTVSESSQKDFTKEKQLSIWSGYFNKTLDERRQQIKHVRPNVNLTKLSGDSLSIDTANIMIENVIGTLSMPVGVSPNFVINDTHYIIPMCVEEPSIVAACSSISKLVAQNGGFSANSTGNTMVSQVQIIHVYDVEKCCNIINENALKYIEIGNKQFCSSMHKRGGGITKIETRVIDPKSTTVDIPVLDAKITKRKSPKRHRYVVVHIHVNVCEAMGANIVNTVAEGLGNIFLDDLKSNKGFDKTRIGLRILTNLCLERRAISSFCIPLKSLEWKGEKGCTVAERVIEAYEFALDDPFRAVTNNKGVMNGIDSVAVALGQDWRAIEAAAHVYALQNGSYGPMAHYAIAYSKSKKCDCLFGWLELPLSVGSKGGALQTHPGYNTTHCLLNGNGNNSVSAQEIAQILVSVGLAQNFAAIRALAIEGIQRGHMSLHAKNIAISVGVPVCLVEEVAHYMVRNNSISAETAKTYL